MVSRILLAALVTLCFAPAFAGEQSCQLQQVAHLAVRITDDGRVMVPVTLEGKEGFAQLVLNSGFSMLHTGYVEQLELSDRLRDVTWGATVGNLKVEKDVVIQSTRFGNVNIARQVYLILPPAKALQPVFEGKPLFGMVASNLLGTVDFELNLGAGEINLFLPNKCDAAFSGLTSAELASDAFTPLYFPMEVEGTVFKTSLNTMSRLSVLHSDASRKYLGLDAKSPGMEREQLSGGREVAVFHAMSLTAKGLEVRNSRVRISEMSACKLEQATPAGIGCQGALSATPFSIGTDLMKRLRIYVSKANRKIYFSRADVAAEIPAPLAEGSAGAPAAAE